MILNQQSDICYLTIPLFLKIMLHVSSQGMSQTSCRAPAPPEILQLWERFVSLKAEKKAGMLSSKATRTTNWTMQDNLEEVASDRQQISAVGD